MRRINSSMLGMDDTANYIEETPNLSYVVELVGTSDFDFEQKFVAILKQEFTSDLGKYLFHIKNEEPRAAAEIVHKLKHKLSVLGMKESFILAERHQMELQTGNTELDSEFKKILKVVDTFLETA
ncbi:Hpt domain-containing protein [Maribacter halichondriae]|uniref:Hpt domain-containing protein n=1 Tax=Maribacter halichondriae TaxID=2980554 RepID=UPI002358BCB9|nr:Hpt domain-containing protein [Maribacter sp. Hal144]